MATMKAVRMHGYGGPEVLQWEEAPRPEAAPGELLVRVHAIGVNPVDWKVREGRLRQSMKLDLPATPGLDFSGVVEAIGPGVADFRPGDAVFGRTDSMHDGAYAEFVHVKAGNVVPKPRRLDHVHAAAVPTAALTAWEALIEAVPPGEAANLEPGQTVLIHGAAGGVGSFAVQFARHVGARVIGTASGRHLEYLRSLGAGRVVDYTRQRFEDVAHDVDVVLDTIGGETQARSWETLRPGGILVSVVGVDEAEARRHGRRAIALLARTNAPILERIARLLETGEVKAPVSQVLPLAEARRAQEVSRNGHVEGKLVLSVAG